MSTIFYSWQSKLPSKINKCFIRAALESAIRAVSRQFTVTEKLSIDEDMSGKSGSPDIINTILTKIDFCSLFVADLTLIGIQERERVPNPNVVLEYGYALKSKRPERIISVMNVSFGSRDSLPFDLKSRCCSVMYDLNERSQCI